MSELTHERLLELLHYDPTTGIFVWLVGRHVRAGDRAGCVQPPAGRGQACRRVRVDGRVYLESRLAWLYMTGEWPAVQIDHCNRDALDNRWSNLRLATCSQNCANRRTRADSTTGWKGVRTTGQRFSAYANVNGKRKYLGTFDNPDEAAAAYQAATRLTYGEYAYHG